MRNRESQPKVRVGEGRSGGRGVFACHAFGREEVVGRVVGTVITDSE